MKHLLALVATALVAASADAAPRTANSGDIAYTDAQFASDCRLAGGTPRTRGNTAECDFPSGNDIICDRKNGKVSGCEQGHIFHSKPRVPDLLPIIRNAPKAVFTTR